MDSPTQKQQAFEIIIRGIDLPEPVMDTLQDRLKSLFLAELARIDDREAPPIDLPSSRSVGDSPGRVGFTMAF